MRVARRYVAIVVVSLVTLLGITTPASPAFAAGTGVVEGVVTAPDGFSVPDGPTRVTIAASPAHATQLVDPATGAFSLTGLPRNDYYSLTVEYFGASNIVSKMSWDGSANGPLIVLGEGEHRSFTIRLVAGGTVTGTLVGQDGAVVELPVVDLGSANAIFGMTATVNPTTGEFTIVRVPPGRYNLVGSSRSPVWDYARWTDSAGGQFFPLTEGGVASGFVITLLRSASIQGTIQMNDGSTVQPFGGSVYFMPVLGGQTASAQSNPETGKYAVYGLIPGRYIVCFGGDIYVVGSCYGGDDYATATPIEVTAHAIILGIDGEVAPGGGVKGRVLAAMSDASIPSAISSVQVRLYRWNDSRARWILERLTYADSNWGQFWTDALPTGDYIVQAVDSEGAFGSRYWRDAAYFAQSEVVHIGWGETVDLGDIILRPRTLDVSRVSGLDRFEVGVAVSRELYPDGQVPITGVPVVYVANGYNFPDALAAGPAASLQGGAVLLVEPSSIPPAVSIELRRLRPQRIVVAGGPASVSPAVFEQLRQFVGSPSQVFRAGGEDRYSASRTVVRDAFERSGATIAIITTGANFPDALSAGPAAASQRGPVILVDGSASSIDNDTAQLLRDLGVSHVYIAGGTGSVSPGIESSLKALLGETAVTRFAGEDRFEVAILLSKEFFAQAEYTFIATGYKFPDALTGGPLAAAFGGPLYLSPPECVPVDVAVDILDLDAQAVVLLGGPASLTSGVENLQLC